MPSPRARPPEKIGIAPKSKNSLLGHLDRQELGVEHPPRVGIERADQAADRGTEHDVDRNPLLLEHAQDADVRETARPAAAQREADASAAPRPSEPWAAGGGVAVRQAVARTARERSSRKERFRPDGPGKDHGVHSRRSFGRGVGPFDCVQVLARSSIDGGDWRHGRGEHPRALDPVSHPSPLRPRTPSMELFATGGRLNRNRSPAAGNGGDAAGGGGGADRLRACPGSGGSTACRRPPPPAVERRRSVRGTWLRSWLPCCPSRAARGRCWSAPTPATTPASTGSATSRWWRPPTSSRRSATIRSASDGWRRPTRSRTSGRWVADPLFALNLCAFPDDAPEEVLTEILLGGAEQLAAARRRRCSAATPCATARPSTAWRWSASPIPPGC